MNPTPTPATTGHTKLLTIEKAASLISWLENTSFKCGEYELDGVTPSQTDEYNDLLGKCITARNEVKAAFGLLISEADSLRQSHARLLQTLQLVSDGLRRGSVKAQPIMDRSDPNAEEWPVRSLSEIVDTAIATATPARDDGTGMDTFAYSFDHCNGPVCVDCGYCRCIHCNEGKKIPRCEKAAYRAATGKEQP